LKPAFDLTLRHERLEQPLRWREPRMIFVNSMSDLFHKEIPAALRKCEMLAILPRYSGRSEAHELS
jgi:protein gp37